jgi:2-isopropylmalate synthase
MERRSKPARTTPLLNFRPAKPTLKAMNKLTSGIKLYDTTLRDGAQREGIALTVEDRLKIAQKLDEFGMHYIEGGFPGSNAGDREFFKQAAKLNLKATLTAFGSTRRKHIAAEDDPGLASLIEVGTPAVCIVGKSWDVHVSEALLTTLEENLKMIRESVAFLKRHGREVIFDAEHFFDGYAANPDYALETITAAQEAGADWVVLCDSNGGGLPHMVQPVVEKVVGRLKVPVGMHAHNDSECAVANSLAAVLAGATQVQGTVNGYGERCGNANLCSIVPDLSLKMGIDAVPAEKLAELTDLAHFVAEVANVVPDGHQPYVGQSAFAHKGGIHVSGMLRKEGAYEHIDPRVVGNQPTIIASELSGTTTILQKAGEIGVDLRDRKDKVADILNKLKAKAKEGYTYDAADGSLGMLILKNIGAYRPLFRLESYQVTVDRRRSGATESQAVVKIRLGEERFVAVAEGNGPVNALDRALKQALALADPRIEKIHLIDYKVRVINQASGTKAKVRVFIESTNGEDTWGTVGVHENIIEASWEALVDSLEYGLARPAEMIAPPAQQSPVT